MYREKNFSGVFEVVKGVVLSVAITFALTFLFALILQLFNLGDGAIRPVNTILKVVAVFLGCFLSVRAEKGLLKGAIVGGISLLLTCFALGAIGGHFPSLFFLELLFGVIVGGISGIITVNVKKR